ncbi:hypothetical protein WJX72_011705 [[Myrmecia] bisecta]|uniref:Dehydrin n=1 Tax=[Myrmecia] bisecta TaxID=41462 RepID=A0AAW1PZM4_9CHLO
METNRVTGAGNPAHGSTAQRVAEKIPGTSEHAATHPTRGTGLDGLGQAVKEHMPGTDQMEAGAAGYGTTAGGYSDTRPLGTTYTGTSAAADPVGEPISGTGYTGHGATGGRTHMGATGAGANWDGEGRTGFAGTSTNSATDNMSTGQKIKSMIPGTTEHTMKKEEQQSGRMI